MGKKMLKRSLALGALMAFVITGNAWAGDSVTVTNKEYKEKSGVILTNTNELQVEDCKFIDNYTEIFGGCISSGTGKLTVDGCEFINNYSVKSYDKAGLSGSAIYITGGEANISNCSFKFHPHTVGNYSNTNGTIYIANNAKVTFENCEFDYAIEPDYTDYQYKNAGNNTHNGVGATFIHAKGSGEVSFLGKNTFKNNNNVGVFGGGGMSSAVGTLIFKEGSETIFENNRFDFGIVSSVTIENNARVLAESAIGAKNLVLNGRLELGGSENPNSSEVGTLSGTGGVLGFEGKFSLAVNTNNCKDSDLTIYATKEAVEAVNNDVNNLIKKIDHCEDTIITITKGGIATETGKIIDYKQKFENDPNAEQDRFGFMYVDYDDPENFKETLNRENQAVGDKGVALKLHWRSHLSDMNKRMGELRDAHGELGAWTRMVRGENEYKGTKAQYNQYQLGYDERLSVDKRWIVGTAVTFADGDASYGYGSTEDKSTAFTVYGTKLNSDGSYVDLIARYEHMESDLKDALSGSGDYCANGMSVGAEFGKRFDQKDGAWIEPQVQLTYGTVDSAEFQLGDKTVRVGDMDSLIGRVGFRIGQDIEQGNVYARASYLYDFDGKTEATFSDASYSKTVKEDLGGGWWEVGIGTNINLSKATYLYAEVDKTFGGEVDTNWQWNLGVRYSF